MFNSVTESAWLTPLPAEVRGPLARDLIRQTDGVRTILRAKPVNSFGQRNSGVIELPAEVTPPSSESSVSSMSSVSSVSSHSTSTPTTPSSDSSVSSMSSTSSQVSSPPPSSEAP
jgi:hypothetical protein